MKPKELTAAGKVFLIGWAALCILIIWVLRAVPLQEPITVSLENSIACEKMNSEWARAENFTVDQPIHVCGEIRSNDPNLHKQIQIRVYENELTSQIDAIFYDNIWISNGDTAIPINTSLSPGIYVIQISSGKKTLSIISIEIVE